MKLADTNTDHQKKSAIDKREHLFWYVVLGGPFKAKNAADVRPRIWVQPPRTQKAWPGMKQWTKTTNTLRHELIHSAGRIRAAPGATDNATPKPRKTYY